MGPTMQLSHVYNNLITALRSDISHFAEVIHIEKRQQLSPKRHYNLG